MDRIWAPIFLFIWLVPYFEQFCFSSLIIALSFRFVFFPAMNLGPAFCVEKKKGQAPILYLWPINPTIS